MVNTRRICSVTLMEHDLNKRDDAGDCRDMLAMENVKLNSCYEKLLFEGVVKLNLGCARELLVTWSRLQHLIAFSVTASLIWLID